MRSEIKRWGNSAAVRLPRKLLAQARLEVSSPVSMTVKGKKIIIEAEIESHSKRLKLPFSEATLLSNLNPETAHADALALPSDSETGD
jgi:antitoxin MazE